MIATVGGTVSQIIAIVVGAFLISGITYIFARNRAMYQDVSEMKRALITPTPSALQPHPQRGLVDVVADHTRKLNVLLGVGKALVADSRSDDGATSRDAIDRIETEQARVAAEHADEVTGA